MDLLDYENQIMSPVKRKVLDFFFFFSFFFFLHQINVLTEIKNLRSHVHRRRPRQPPFLRVLSEGMGVTSSIRPIFIPEQARALSADWAPGPGVLVLFPPVARSLMWRAVMPVSLHLWATSWAANMAAYGEDSSRSAFTFIPPVTRQMVSLGTKHRILSFLPIKDSECISHPKDTEHYCPGRAEDEGQSEQAS